MHNRRPSNPALQNAAGAAAEVPAAAGARAARAAGAGDQIRADAAAGEGAAARNDDIEIDLLRNIQFRVDSDQLANNDLIDFPVSIEQDYN